MNATVSLTSDDLATLNLQDVVIDGRHLVWLGRPGRRHGHTFAYVTVADCRRIGDAWHNLADALATGLDEAPAFGVGSTRQPALAPLMRGPDAPELFVPLARGQDIARRVLAQVNRGGAL